MIWVVLAPGPASQVLQRHIKKWQFLPGRMSCDLHGLHFTHARTPISTHTNPTTRARIRRLWARQAKSTLWFNPAYVSQEKSYPRNKKQQTKPCLWSDYFYFTALWLICLALPFPLIITVSKQTWKWVRQRFNWLEGSDTKKKTEKLNAEVGVLQDQLSVCSLDTRLSNQAKNLAEVLWKRGSDGAKRTSAWRGAETQSQGSIPEAVECWRAWWEGLRAI